MPSILFNFSLYGFLKNQLYFDPFLIIYLKTQSLSWFSIGLLLGIRDLTVNIFEIPSGFISDRLGRRRTLIFGWLCYISSFIFFIFASNFLLFLPAFLLFGIGESFRSGTHKAIIFSWLKSRNMEDQRTKVYGYTRSWSQIGSAVSVIIAGTVVILWGNIRLLFIITLIPYLFGLVNFMFYPVDESVSALSREAKQNSFIAVLKDLFTRRHLLKAMFESLSFEGIYQVFKPWFQVFLFTGGLLLASRSDLASSNTSAGLTIMAGYALLHLIGAVGSRSSHSLRERLGSEVAAMNFLWLVFTATFISMAITAFFGLYLVAGFHFIILSLAYNLWRPIFLSYFDNYTPENLQATVLSMESQAKSLSKAILAPCIGFIVDFTGLRFVPTFFLILIVISLLIISRFRNLKPSTNIKS